MASPNTDFVATTFDGLQNWLKHEYEHLGWNTLSVVKGNSAKALAYLESLEKLGTAIQERKTLESSNLVVMRDLSVLEWKLTQLKEMTTKLGLNKSTLKDTVCGTVDAGRRSSVSSESVNTRVSPPVPSVSRPRVSPKSKSSSTFEDWLGEREAAHVGGGKKKKLSKKTSKKTSKKSSKKSQKGGVKRRSKKASKKTSKKVSKKTSRK